MSESHVFICRIDEGLKEESAGNLMKVLPPQFSVQGPTSGWDFGRDCVSDGASNASVVGLRWGITTPHAASFVIGWVGERCDVLLLTVTERNRTRLLQSLEDDGCTWMGLLDGLSTVAGASFSLSLVDTDVLDAIAAIRSQTIIDSLVPRVCVTWGDLSWADAVISAGGRAEPTLNEHAAIRV
ncbi:MAG: hypothetical protein KDA52_07260 [Planctomycetaceae bacterium]|nr:hypothetical protein [Planctomycetaceae bacterium]